MTYCMPLWIGTFLFLYSNYALAASDIYDPMNPNETITPIPNEQIEDTQESKAEITFESSETIDSSIFSNESSSEQKKEDPKEKIDISREATNTSEQAVKDKTNKEVPSNERFPDSEKRADFINQSLPRLMLDDNFFSTATSIATHDPSSGGEAGESNVFCQTAMSAYLLSGIVLYGEVASDMEMMLSDSIA